MYISAKRFCALADDGFYSKKSHGAASLNVWQPFTEKHQANGFPAALCRCKTPFIEADVRMFNGVSMCRGLYSPGCGLQYHFLYK